MQEKDLIAGDVIFFENNYKNDEGGYDYIDHVAIYDGLDEKNQPTLIHCISSEMGAYYPARPSGLCKTTLRALKNLIQKEEGYPDVSYDVHYKVFRCQNEAIVARVLEVLHLQLAYIVPYDDLRLKEKIDLEDTGLSPEDFKELAESRYRSEGIYRSIKFAARHLGIWTRPRVDGIGRGLTCAMTVVLAYQVAELLCDDKIRALSVVVSDKHAPINRDYPEDYIKYILSLRQDRSYNELGTHLSYDFWKDPNLLPEHYTHSTFAMDAKTINASGLFSYMLSKPSMWQDLGYVSAERRVFDATQRQENRSENRNDFFTSIGAMRTLSIYQPSQISSRPSSTPYEEEEDSDIVELDDGGGCDIFSRIIRTAPISTPK